MATTSKQVRSFQNNVQGGNTSAFQSNQSSNMDMVGKAFRYINSYKRSRALAETSRQEGDINKAMFNELKQYKNIDGLELALRALQRGLRDMEEVSED